MLANFLCLTGVFWANSASAGEPATQVPTSAQILNLSTRVSVGLDDRVGIIGFVVPGYGGPQRVSPDVEAVAPGTQLKKIVICALGPSLAVNGQLLAGTLQDPQLELHDSSGAIIAFNDNWRSGQAAELVADGFAPASDREAAYVADLPRGQYTVVVRGTGGTTGISLVEVYDLDANEFVPLVNMSTRGQTLAGNEVLVSGLIVQGSDTVPVLFRALGPGLSAFKIAGALADPTLQIFDSNGSPLGFNDNWKDSQSAVITATGLSPGDDRESAIMLNLGAGSYTAVLRGKSNTTGIALIEAYKLN